MCLEALIMCNSSTFVWVGNTLIRKQDIRRVESLDDEVTIKTQISRLPYCVKLKNNYQARKYAKKIVREVEHYLSEVLGIDLNYYKDFSFDIK